MCILMTKHFCAPVLALSTVPMDQILEWSILNQLDTILKNIGSKCLEIKVNYFFSGYTTH